MLDTIGWRTTLMLLGFCNLVLCVGLHGWVIDPVRDAVTSATREVAPQKRSNRPLLGMLMRYPAFWGLAVAFAVYYGVFSGITYHLYPLLLERGVDALDVVSIIALIGPAQVAGRIVLWAFAARRSIRLIGAVTVVVFPVAFLLLAMPAGYTTLVVFALTYGAANGVMTIVRGLTVPEMLTREAYGAVNGLLAAPSIVAKAMAPVLAAMLYAAAGGYHAVIAAALIGSVIVAASFGVAAITSAGAPAIKSPATTALSRGHHE